MLHRVLEDTREAYDPEMAVSDENFERFLAWVSRHYRVVRLQDLQQELRGWRCGSPPLCVLTFDDGWSDNFTCAFPMLQRYNLTATVFLAVNFIGTGRRLWQERLWRHLQRAGKTSSAAESLRATGEAFAWCPPLGAADLNLSRLRPLLLTRPSPEAEAFVDRFGRIVGGEPEWAGPAFLSWDQVQRMRECGIDFGSHTMQHTLLSRAPTAVAEAEVCDSRRAIEERLGAPVCSFSYPWGARGPASRAQVESAGYAFAVTASPGLARSDSDALQLPRVALSDACFGRASRPGGDGLSGKKRTQDAFSAAALSLHIARARFSNLRVGRPS
ncbi:MAG: polysaccharide deacetylase family protein [Terriglobales bacterium]